MIVLVTKELKDTKELKSSLGIRAKSIIENGLNLKFDRHNKASCPFHKEKTPSFSWNDADYNFKCFGCGETLDIFRYFTEFQNMNFIEAIKVIEDILGVQAESTVTTYNVQSEKKYNKPNVKNRELNIKEFEIWNKRGITQQTLEHWVVKGYTDDKGNDWMKFFYKDEKGNVPYVNMRA